MTTAQIKKLVTKMVEGLNTATTDELPIRAEEFVFLEYVMSVAEPLVDADAPPASDKDTPASPNTRRAVLRRFRFEANFAAAILNPPILSGKCSFNGRPRRWLSSAEAGGPE